jgi:hypothetical protein
MEQFSKMDIKIAKAPIITHTESEDFEETITIKIRGGESIEDSVNRVHDEFNAEEIRRSNKYDFYPCGQKRSLKEIVHVDMLDGLIYPNWRKLTEYFDGLSVFECENSGLFAKAQWWPSMAPIGKYICTVCNSHFMTEDEYQAHLTEPAHMYCERRGEDVSRVYFTQEFSRYLSQLEEEEYERLLEESSAK